MFVQHVQIPVAISCIKIHLGLYVSIIKPEFQGYLPKAKSPLPFGMFGLPPTHAAYRYSALMEFMEMSLPPGNGVAQVVEGEGGGLRGLSFSRTPIS